MDDVTRVLDAAAGGDAGAADALLPLVYDELRRLAAQRLADEVPGQTLEATALVHEAYLRLVGTSDRPWDNRGHFFAAAAEAMRRILIERARRRQRHRHGGGRRRVELAEHDIGIEPPAHELLAIDEALTKLAAEDPQAAALVKLRFYAGLSTEDAGAALGMARASAYRLWSYARAWLRCAVAAE